MKDVVCKFLQKSEQSIAAASRAYYATDCSASWVSIHNAGGGDMAKTATEHLHAHRRRYEAMTRHVRGGIDKLQKYRSALISAAVTGKIDVRKSFAEKT